MNGSLPNSKRPTDLDRGAAKVAWIDEQSLDGLLGDLPIWQACLEHVGCMPLDALTLAIATCWGLPGDLDCAGRRSKVEGLHRAACQLPGVKPCAFDMRPAAERSAAERNEMKRMERFIEKATEVFGTEVIDIMVEEALTDHVKRYP